MMSSHETTPALDNDQRSRLIKSSRKMGRMLGTTPRVHHEPALRTFALAPFDRTSSSSRPSTGSSTRTLPSRLPVITRPHTSSGIPTRSPSIDFKTGTDASVLKKDRRPAALVLSPPVLRFKTSSASLRPRAPSPTPSLASPTTPTGRASTPPPDLAELRRKKMDKLMRTLGEHIPAELVFPGLPPSPHTKAQRRRSLIQALTNLTNTPRSPTFSPAPSPPLQSPQPAPTPKRRGYLAASLFRKPSTTLRAAISASKPWPNLTGYEEPAYPETTWETTPLSRPETPWETAEAPRTIVHWGEIAPRPQTPLDTPALTPADTPISSPMPSPPPSAPSTPPRESLDSEELHITPLSPPPLKQTIRRSQSARATTRVVPNHTHSRSQVMPPPDSPTQPTQSRPQSPFVGSLVPLVEGAPPVPPVPWLIEGEEAIVRKERKEGWSGEWNQGNMQDVIQKLRALR